jgi:hypothetical protein
MATSFIKTLGNIFFGGGNDKDDEDPFAYHANIPLNPNDEREDYDDDDDDEEEQQMVEKSRWENEKEFAEYVYKEARLFSKRTETELLQKCDFYFGMVSTDEKDRGTGRIVKVWWLPKNHPYAEMIVEENLKYLNDYDQLHFPNFAAYLNMVLYMDYVIEEAIHSCQLICWNNQLPVEKPLITQNQQEQQQEEQKEEETTMFNVNEIIPVPPPSSEFNNKKDD